ncbi:uncharacterized protein LOC141842817 [Curcuma longa]|uniref:uncharacterized protein LOC141842817 n=1 Tax=Curcuma longa TaxID=136217 RepID=UPI003D9E25D3
MDYFSKWVEAEPLARITEDVLKFLWKNIICGYEIPRKIVFDNGRLFQGYKIQDWCKELGIIQAFTSVAYPQSNGQVEVVNKELVKVLKIKMDQVQGNWVDELPGIIWAYRTTLRDSTQREAVIPIEVGEESSRVLAYGSDNSGKQCTKLDLITETRELAAIRLATYRLKDVPDLQQEGYTSLFSGRRLRLEEK